MEARGFRNPSCLRLLNLGIFGLAAVWGALQFAQTGDTTYLVGCLIAAALAALLWFTIPRKQL